MQNDLIVGHLGNHNIFLGYAGRFVSPHRKMGMLVVNFHLTGLASMVNFFLHMGKNMY